MSTGSLYSRRQVSAKSLKHDRGLSYSVLEVLPGNRFAFPAGSESSDKVRFVEIKRAPSGLPFFMMPKAE